MPVEFLSDDQASAYGRFTSGFTRAELERYFFLDDVDRALIEPKRRDHNKLGFAVQLAPFAMSAGSWTTRSMAYRSSWWPTWPNSSTSPTHCA